MDSILSIDQELVTDAVRTLALNTIQAYHNGVSLKWHDAELGIYLVYIFGEINKSQFVLLSKYSRCLLPCMYSWRQRPCRILPSTASR